MSLAQHRALTSTFQAMKPPRWLSWTLRGREESWTETEVPPKDPAEALGGASGSLRLHFYPGKAAGQEPRALLQHSQR